MKKISTSFRDEQLEAIRERVQGEEPNPDEGAYESRAEALRELVDKGLEHDDVVDDLERDIDHLEARIDELTNQLQHERERQEEHNELVEYVQDEKSLQQRREARERRKDNATIVERTKARIWGWDAVLDEDVDDDRDGAGRDRGADK